MAVDIAIKVFIIAASLIVGITSTLIFKLRKDNPIEEVAEEIIKDQTGEDIDLSPDSPENKKE